MFAAACGVRARDAAHARRALLPIAIGHAASVAVVACAVALGMWLDRGMVQGVAGALLIGAASYRLMRGTRQSVCISTQAGHAGIALWSFLMATAHGAGMMLVPALVPLCLADSPAREITASGSLVLALTVVGIHTAAMLATAGVIATGVSRGVVMFPHLVSGAASRRLWTAILTIMGALLVVFR
jgi:hypothetical protein